MNKTTHYTGSPAAVPSLRFSGIYDALVKAPPRRAAKRKAETGGLLCAAALANLRFFSLFVFHEFYGPACYGNLSINMKYLGS